MDPLVTPILLKTIDWLFGEGSKILQERRERRKQNSSSDIGSADTVTTVLSTPRAPDVIQSKEAALQTPVPESVWANSESNIRHLLSLLEIQKRNYYLAKEQYAKWGSSLVPPIITHNLTEAENEIASIMRELQIALKTVYGKEIAVPELEQK
jgi:hypothetical protein